MSNIFNEVATIIMIIMIIITIITVMIILVISIDPLKKLRRKQNYNQSQNILTFFHLSAYFSFTTNKAELDCYQKKLNTRNVTQYAKTTSGLESQDIR